MYHFVTLFYEYFKMKFLELWAEVLISFWQGHRIWKIVHTFFWDVKFFWQSICLSLVKNIEQSHQKIMYIKIYKLKDFNWAHCSKNSGWAIKTAWLSNLKFWLSNLKFWLSNFSMLFLTCGYFLYWIFCHNNLSALDLVESNNASLMESYIS